MALGSAHLRRGMWVCAMLTILATHTTYIPNGFAWLDHGDVVDGRAILPFSQILSAFVTPFGETSFYRPLVTLTLSADSALYGDRAWGFHLTNVLLHAGACAAFFWAGRKLITLPAWMLGCGLVVAGVHPLSWLPVGAISYRPDLLAVLFTFLALGCYEEVRRKRGATWWLVGLAGSTALAFLSKETALFWVPALCVLRELQGDSRQKSSSLGVSVVAGLLVVYAVVRYAVVPEGWSRTAVPLSFVEGVATRLGALTRQLIHVVDPRLPELSDAMPILGFGWMAFAGGVALIAMMVGSLRWRDGRVGWFLGFCLIALLPSLNLVPLPRFTSPHYGYLLSFALGLAVVLIVDRLHRSGSDWHRLGFVGLALWVLGAGVSTYRGGTRFADDATLFGVAVAVDPRFLEGHHYLGEAASRQGDFERAAKHFQASLKFWDDTIAYVDWFAASSGLAEVRVRQGRYAEADRLLLALQEHAEGSRLRSIVYNRAVVAQRQERHADAVDLLVTEPWDRPEPILLLARSLSVLGKIKEAVIQMERVVPLVDEARQSHVKVMIQSMKEGVR